MKRKEYFGSLMLLISAMMWGGSYAVQNILSTSFQTYSVIFLKSVGGIVLLVFCIFARKKIDKKTLRAGFITGLTNCTGLIIQQIGIANTSVSKSSFISGLYVIIVPIFGLFSNKKPKRKFWLAVLIAFIGMYLLCMNGNESLGKGDLYVLVSIIFFAYQIILIDKYGKELDPLAYCAVQQITSATVSGSLAMIIEKPQFSNIGNMIFPVLYVMFMSGLVAQIFQNKYQKLVSPTLASLIMSLESVFGALGGMIFLHQFLTVKELIGCILMFVAIIIAE